MCKSKKPGLKKPMKKDLIKGTSQPFEASVVVKTSAFPYQERKSKSKPEDNDGHPHKQGVGLGIL